MIARLPGACRSPSASPQRCSNSGQPVEDVCREMDDAHPSSVVSRWPAATSSTPSSRPTQHTIPAGTTSRKSSAWRSPSGTCAATRTCWPRCGSEDPLAAFRDLARRHDFVLPVSRRLHDDVRDTLRTDLLDPYRRARTRQINQRALALFDARLGQMRRRWPTLDEQLGHTGFTTALLAALWHTLWADNRAGLDLFIRVLPVLALADPPTINGRPERPAAGPRRHRGHHHRVAAARGGGRLNALLPPGQVLPSSSGCGVPDLVAGHPRLRGRGWRRRGWPRSAPPRTCISPATTSSPAG